MDEFPTAAARAGIAGALAGNAMTDTGAKRPFSQRFLKGYFAPQASRSAHRCLSNSAVKTLLKLPLQAGQSHARKLCSHSSPTFARISSISVPVVMISPA
jgi:hypothetical protein